MSEAVSSLRRLLNIQPSGITELMTGPIMFPQIPSTCAAPCWQTVLCMPTAAPRKGSRISDISKAGFRLSPERGTNNCEPT